MSRRNVTITVEVDSDYISDKAVGYFTQAAVEEGFKVINAPLIHKVRVLRADVQEVGG